MNVWLIKVGEPLPTDSVGIHLNRNGLLANALIQREHRVTWWTSSVNHQQKQQRCLADRVVEVHPGYEIRILATPLYRRNVSLARIRSETTVARKFALQAKLIEQPDIIVSSLPTPDLCASAVEYGRHHSIPVVLDIRDLWPEAIAQLAPRVLRPLARICLTGQYRQLRSACSGAAAIVGVTDAFVDWGLAHANRPRSEMDQHFPLGATHQPPTLHEQEESLAFWGKYGIRPEMDELLIAYVGVLGGRNLEEFKSVIKAAEILQDRDIPVRIVLAGDGDKMSYFQKRAAGASNIVFPGWINKAQAWTLMQCAGAGIIPYESSFDFCRSFPNKIIEYLSAGLPVISSIRGVASEYLDAKKCGITYPNKDASALANVIQMLEANRGSLGEMSERAMSAYKHEFIADTVYGRMAEHLEKLTMQADVVMSDARQYAVNGKQ